MKTIEIKIQSWLERPTFQFQVHTRLNYLKFEFLKIFWGGAHRAPSPALRASPSNLGRFALSIQASPDLDPPTFEAWRRPCTDIHHYNSFHLVPNSTIHVPSHLLIILNSSIRFRPRSSYPPSLFHTSPPCSWILLLLTGDVELNPGPSALTFTRLNIRSIRSFEKSSSTIIWLIILQTFSHSMKPGCNPPILTISFPHFHFLIFLISSGFSILNSPRLTGHGGGLAVIHRSSLKIKSLRARNFLSPVSFELMTTKLTSGNNETIFLNIYRPPSSKISTFFDEFQNFEFFFPSPSEVIITGDIHTNSDLSSLT